MKASHLIGQYRPDGVGHFLPWVSLEEPPNNGLYPAGFTLNQMFEIEWATRYMRVRATTVTSFSTMACDAQKTNDWFGQESIADTNYSVSNEADLWKRAGCAMTFNTRELIGDLAVIGPSDATSVQIQIAPRDNYKFWYPDFPYPPQFIHYTPFALGGAAMITGSRMHFWDGLFWPAMEISIFVQTQNDDLTEGASQLYATGDLYGETGIFLGPSAQNLTIAGSDWAKVIPLLTSGQILSPDADLETYLSGDMRIDLVAWPYA